MPGFDVGFCKDEELSGFEHSGDVALLPADAIIAGRYLAIPQSRRTKALFTFIYEPGSCILQAPG